MPRNDIFISLFTYMFVLKSSKSRLCFYWYIHELIYTINELIKLFCFIIKIVLLINQRLNNLSHSTVTVNTSIQCIVYDTMHSTSVECIEQEQKLMTPVSITIDPMDSDCVH